MATNIPTRTRSSIIDSRTVPVINFTKVYWTGDRARSLTVKFLSGTARNKPTPGKRTRTSCYQRKPASIPNLGLEIFADDVKCTHGAAIGQLDEEELFYLESRGINPGLARNLLTYGFAGEVIQRIKVHSIRRELDAAVLNRLHAELEGELTR